MEIQSAFAVNDVVSPQSNATKSHPNQVMSHVSSDLHGNNRTQQRATWGRDISGFIFEHLARNPRFANVTRRPTYSRGRSGFLPVAIEGMSFFIALFLKEKGTFGFLGALSPSKSPKSQKDLFFEKTNR